MKFESEAFPEGIGRIFSVYVLESTDKYKIVEGDCAWSVSSAMRNLDSVIAKLQLSVEIYEEEYGVGFQGHHLYINGGWKEKEIVDYFEYCIEDIEEGNIDFFDTEETAARGITKENYMEYAEDGWITVGGFDDWEFRI